MLPVTASTSRDRQLARHVVFWLDRRCLALPIETVREVVEGLAVTAVPDAPPSVLGIASLRGTVMSITDLHHVLYGRPSPTSPTRFLIAVRDRTVVSGLTVDGVQGVVQLARATPIQDHAPSARWIRAHHDIGLDALVAELDAEWLFAHLDSQRMAHAADASKPIRRSSVDE